MNYIKLTETDIQSYLANFETMLKNMDMTDNITLKVSAVKPDVAKAVLVFSELAYYKMRALVMESGKEVGWHGYTHRDGNTFYVDDIIVFPQTVTAATVTPDEAAYTNWTIKLSDEEYNKIHFHGHSHVNMATNPSGVDTTYYGNKIKNVEDYYIFIIMNKSDSIYARIYDFENNIYYEKEDIVLIRPTDKHTEWAKKQLTEFVTEERPTSYATPQQYAEYWGQFGHTNYGRVSHSDTATARKAPKAGYHYADTKSATKKTTTKKAAKKTGPKVSKRIQNIIDTHTMDDIRRLSEDEAIFLVDLIQNDSGLDMKVTAEWSDDEYNELIDKAYGTLK